MEPLAPEAASLYPVNEPSRKGRLEAYLWDYGEGNSIHVAEDFYDPHYPMADTAVLIPVAAHQEADRIVPAMAEYAKQEDADPFTVFLLLNYPFDNPEASADASVRQVETAMKQFPNLDIRYSICGYSDPVIIGTIRKDLWDAALRVALTDGHFDEPGRDVIGISHDIDTVRMSRHYMRNVQARYRQMQALLGGMGGSTETTLPSMHTQVKHAYPFDTHPNIARAIFWSDLTYRQVFRNGLYEEGVTVPFSLYAKRRGFDKDAVIHETRRLAPHFNVGIPLTGMDSSPRRYIARLGKDNLAEIWTEDTFGSGDACRDPNALPGDISHAELEERIFETLEQDIDTFVAGVPEKWVHSTIDGLVRATRAQGYFDRREFIENVQAKLTSRLNLARFALARIVQSPLLASMVDNTLLERYTDETIGAILEAVTKETAPFEKWYSPST